MKNKLIKKYLLGTTLTPAWTADTFDDLPTRKYYWKLWNPEMKVKTDYQTGEPLNENWKVLVDDLGNIVDPSNPQVLADYAALSGNGSFKANHPGVTFTFDKNTKQKFVLPTTETADERIKRISNAPIATQKLWELIKQEEDAERFTQTPEGHKIWLHEKDKEANAKTPGVGMLFGVPLALGAGTAVLLTNPIALPASILGARAGEVTADYLFQQQGYSSFGDWLFEGTNTPEWIKENSNPGLWLGGGMGWNIGKGAEKVLGVNLLKRPILLADTYAEQWAEEDMQKRLRDAFLNNYWSKIPQAIEDVEAIELSSRVPKTPSLIKRPGVFYSKAGETNKGSTAAIATDLFKTDLFKSDPELLNDFKKLFAYMVLSGGDSAGLYGTIDLGLPKNIQDYIMHNIIGRRIIAGNKGNWWAGNVQNRAKEVMNEVKVGEFPGLLFKDTGVEFAGRYSPENNFIAVNVESTKFTPDYIKKHEGDHLINNTIPLTKEQEDILAKALDKDFLDLPNKSNAGTLKGYLHMDAERTTTIHDAVRRLLSEELLKWDINLQNKLIDKLSDEKIFKALEQSNGYGRRYVEFLRESGGLTHEKANQIRSAMKVLCATGDINEGSVVGNFDIKNFLNRLYKARRTVPLVL